MKKILSLVLFLCWPFILLAATPTQQLAQLLQNTSTLQANFVQKIYDESGTVIDQSSGQFILARPNQFRWQVLKPMNQLVVSNGQKIWTYDADLEQVVVKSVGKAIAATPLAILSGDTNALIKDFIITGRGNVYYLHAKQSDTNFTDINLYFSNNTIVGMTLFDNLGQKTELHFTQLKTNVAVTASDFVFVPPQGVDVVQG